jgi:hypothetical protein
MADGNQLCTVVAKPHPFDSDTVYCEFQAGQTIAEMLGAGVSNTANVTCGGYPVPREAWGRVRPKAGVTLHVTMYPQGGNAGKWVRLVAIVAITYFSGGAGAGLAGALGGSATAWGAAFMLVGTLAVNALIPPPTPKGLGGAAGDPFQQLSSITGTSNQANPYGVIPCVVGSTRFFPPHAALPYTEISGRDQYLRMLLDLGYGDLDVSDIRIGETAIDSYDDVEYEISTAPTLFTQDIYELAVGATLAAGTPVQRTTQGASTEISLDIVFGNGLYGIDKKGNETTGTVTFVVQYRPVGTSTWLNVSSASGVTVTGGLRQSGTMYSAVSSAKMTLRCGIRWRVAPGQYDVQVARYSSSFPGAVDGAIADAATWSVLRSINPQLPSTTGTLKLAVRIKATDQINGVVSNLSVLATQKVRRWDGSGWSGSTGSVNPAEMYHWLLTDCPAVMRRLTDDRVDGVGIAAWAGECENQDYRIGFVMDSGRAFGDVLRDVLAAGRASFGLRNSLYSAVRDIPQTVPVQMFTPANSWGFSYSRQFMDLPHALRVKFTNPEANNQQDVRIVYWNGYTAANATRFEDLDLSMVIDPDTAWRLGRYHLAVAYGRLTQYTLSADIEQLVCERGDLVTVAHDITGWGVAWGRIKAVSGATVTLDGPVQLEAGKDYQFRVRKGDLAQVAQTITTGAGYQQTLTLAAAITGMAPGDLYEVGEVGHGVAALIVRQIDPGDELTATLTCVDADPEVWTADAGTPPPFTSDITGTSWCAPPDPPVVHIRAGESAPDGAGIVQARTWVGLSGGAGIHRLPNIAQG